MIDEDNFWSNWWNEDWQGKPKYSEKTYPSATLSTTKSHMTDPISTVDDVTVTQFNQISSRSLSR
jgi:hypothetical protein